MEPDAPISGRSPRVQTFACRAAPVGLGSQLPFAAIRLNVRFADEVDIVSDERMAASLSWPTL